MACFAHFTTGLLKSKTCIYNFCRYLEDWDKKVMSYLRTAVRLRVFILGNLMQILYLKLMAFVNHALNKI